MISPLFTLASRESPGAKSKLSPDRAGKNNLPFAGNAGFHP